MRLCRVRGETGVVIILGIVLGDFAVIINRNDARLALAMLISR